MLKITDFDQKLSAHDQIGIGSFHQLDLVETKLQALATGVAPRGGYVDKATPELVKAEYKNKDGVTMSLKVTGKSLGTSMSTFVKARLKVYQQESATTLLKLLADRLPVPEVATKLASLFHLRKLPFLTVQTGAADTALEEHGLDELTWLQTNKFSFLPDAKVLKLQLTTFYKFVKKNYNIFVKTERTDNGSLLKKLNMHAVFKYVTTTHEEGKKIPDICHIINYILGYAFGSCEVERFGSILKNTKTDKRKQLGDETYNALCFIKHVMPGLKYVDYEHLVRAWYEEGHMDAVSIARGDKPGIVLARIDAEQKKRSYTPIGTKQDEG